ncbi:MAG: hypothetical protein M3O02_07320 [Acidobacteriota bacterium]|nr:hypothetical protein [Acidobacteriota bacterium]
MPAEPFGSSDRIETFAATPEQAQIRYGAEPRVVRLQAEQGEEQAEPEVKPVAVLVCHGMGQQVRFETIGQLASSILNAAEANGCTVAPNGVHLSCQEKGFLARAELNWTDAAGEPHQVHMYEAYWAPITEDKVTYRDTLQFLFQAAWRGIRCSSLLKRSTFERWMFFRMQKLTITTGTQIALWVVACLLVVEAAAIAYVTLRVAAGVKEVSAIQWPHLPPLAWSLGSVRTLLAFLLADALQLLKPFLPQHGTLHHPASLGGWLGAVWRTVAWLVLIAHAFFVRYFLVQYAGDVAAYISPFKASKFDTIRTQIQSVGLTVGKAIYGFDSLPGIPDYERIVFAGHSLGSVLAYDTLNALLNTDLTSANPGGRRVAERTTHLITFGSPLDKTAFLFRTQANYITDPIREQMSAAFQPLILYREIRERLCWINLWSMWDVISGALDYYGDGDEKLVHNRRDPSAWIPFAAHVQYWKGRLLAETLYDAVT